MFFIFPRNLPFEKIVRLSKISLLSIFFFWILIKYINSNLHDMKESTYENFPNFSVGGFFFRNSKKKCSRTFIILLRVWKKNSAQSLKYFSKNMVLKIGNLDIDVTGYCIPLITWKLCIPRKNCNRRKVFNFACYIIMLNFFFCLKIFKIFRWLW